MRVRRYHLRRLSDISAVLPRSVHVLIVDVENTLLPYAGQGPRDCAELLASLRVILAQISVGRLILISNGDLDLEDCCRNSPTPTRYVRRARKPWTSRKRLTGQTGNEEIDGVVIGDQVLTDGLLAVRLGIPFIHVAPKGREPLWPRLQRALGALVSRYLFEKVMDVAK